MMAFKPDAAGVKAFTQSGALVGDLGTSYIGSWVGDLITLGAASRRSPAAWPAWSVRSRLLFAIVRDLSPEHALGRTGPNATPAAAATIVVATVAA